MTVTPNNQPREQDLLELVFPIMGVKTDKKPATVCGTAFSIGGDAYMTAGHVWENAQAYPLPVFSETETLAKGSQVTKLIKTEALHLGIAIRSDVVAGISSALLGLTRVFAAGRGLYRP